MCNILGMITCTLIGHKVSDDDENRLVETPIEIKCMRCKANLTLEQDPTDPDSYFINEE